MRHKKPLFSPCDSPSLFPSHRIFSGSENVYSIKKHCTLFRAQKRGRPTRDAPFDFKLSGAVAVPMP